MRRSLYRQQWEPRGGWERSEDWQGIPTEKVCPGSICNGRSLTRSVYMSGQPQCMSHIKKNETIIITRLTLLWFDLSKSFKICLLAKWLSIFLNLLKHSIIFCYCTTTPFNTLWKDLKGRKIGLWYTPMIKVRLFRELFHLSKPFICPFFLTVF